VKKANASPGSDVITYKRKQDRATNQLWWCDQTGFIRSAMNDYALEATGVGQNIRTMPYCGRPDQQWVFSGNKIINKVRPTECLSDKDMQRPIEVKAYQGKPKQHWRMEYVS